MSKQNVQTQRRYPPELRERAVRMVREAIAQAGGERHGVVTRVAIQLGMGSETLRHWVKQAEVDGGQRPGCAVNPGPSTQIGPVGLLSRQDREDVKGRAAARPSSCWALLAR